MAIIQRIRKRHSEMAPIKEFQAKYLMYDGLHEFDVKDFTPWIEYFDFCKLCEGQQPVNFDPLMAKDPSELWKQYGPDYLKIFISETPGTRPLAWWQWEAPGAADPKGRDTDQVKFFKAQNLARNRARWPHEKQAEFLRTHGLLTKQEERRT